MVIVRLKGGLGNQLFQYAFGRAVALLKKDELFFDLTYLTVNPLNFIPRDFKLASLKHYQITDEVTINKFNALYQIGNGIAISDRFPKDAIISALTEVKIKAAILDGYYQDEFYFLQYASFIQNEVKDFLNRHYKSLSIRNGFLDDDQENVSIHVRRGDYVLPETMKVHGICEAGYYKEAISIMKSKLKNPHFYVFSDDAHAADRLFNGLLSPDERTNISSVINDTGFSEKDLIEMKVMSDCKHFILANSSFSWWGSYLSNSAQKIVIAPKKWYHDQDLTYLSDAIGLPSWIRI